MKRDTLFYRLFSQAPNLLSELVSNPPDNAQNYRFDSVSVKESKFEIDGVFLPPTGSIGPVYFCEFQMQIDETLYERGFAESSAYFYRNRSKFSDWQMIFIYPSRKTEQKERYPHRSLLNSEQVHRIYLDELGDVQYLPLWVGLLVLTSRSKQQEAMEEAGSLLVKAQQETISEAEKRVIIDMVTTIIWYRFETLDRKDVEAMLNIKTKETRLYREGQMDGRQEGRQEGQAELITRLLVKRFGSLTEGMQGKIQTLSSSLLAELGEAILDFSTVEAVESWLNDRT